MQSLDPTRKRWTLVAVSLAVFMTAIDNTVVNVALPSIRRDLGLGQSALEWIVNGYVLAFASLLLTGGRLGDLLGRKRMFLLGLAVFTAASLLAGFAGGEALLVAARALQGVGAALLAPATLAIVSAAFPEEERGKAIGVWAAVGALGFAVGPVTGGVLAEHVHWSWIFWVNVPVGLGALAVGRTAISESRDESGGRTVDVGGVLASAAGLLALTYALIEGNRYGWGSPTILGLLAAAGAAGALFVRHERRAGEPMLDLTLFRRRAFAGGNVVLVLSGFGLFGVFFFLSLYLQGTVGLSAVQGGLAFTPMAAVLVAGAPLSAALADRFGAGRVVASGMLLFGLGLYLLAGAEATSTYADVLPGLLVAALGSALTTPLTTAVVSSVPVERAGVASGALNTSRELAGALGIAVLGAILAARERASLAHGASASAAFVSGYSLALTIGAAVMVVGAAVAALALRPAGARSRPQAAPRRHGCPPGPRTQPCGQETGR
jgi:EmrB/QacA subfamily drug resistance transporter